MFAKRITIKLLAYVLAFAMLFALLPSLTFAAEDTASFDATTTAIMAPTTGNHKELVIEAYLTNKTRTETTVRPCDIIFVMDQSKWMNTEDDNGDQRAVILDAMRGLLESITAPDEGEHRVAIVGYGRVNLGGGSDPYDPSVFPGKVSPNSGISFNTGYYTTSGFVSTNGWSDVSGSMISSALPTMPAGYLTNESYENAFMSLEDASSVLDPENINAWYAGASRMDAGLTIAQQLSDIAANHDPDGDRDLIVCIMASSLPIQHNTASGESYIRDSAVLAAANALKAKGASIFAFGDYHSSGRTMTSGNQDTEANFNSVMSSVCTKDSNFFPLSGSVNVASAMNQLITEVSVSTAGDAIQDYTVTASDFVVTGTTTDITGTTDESGVKTVTWADIKDYYDAHYANLLSIAKAKVEYFNFAGYDAAGVATFDTTPRASYEVSLSTMVSGDEISYATRLVPIQPPEIAASGASVYAQSGFKIVITISMPITITYEWAESSPAYAPSHAMLPAREIMVLGTTHYPATVSNIDEHYRFDGWFLDKACTVQYTGKNVPDTDFTLYGKWSRFALVEYFWNIWDSGYDYADSSQRVTLGTTPELFTPTGVEGYTFGGWYLDKDYTVAYTPAPIDMDIELYAKWLPNYGTGYTVKFYQQNLTDDGYTEITADTLRLTGKTDSFIATITKTYTGFTRSAITYENSTHQAQTAALKITGDGSLVVKVYFDRNTYTVTYSGNGHSGGTVPTDAARYKYGATVTVQDATMTRDNHAFTGWNTVADGTGSSHLPSGTFIITENTTLHAQWTPKPSKVEGKRVMYAVEHYVEHLDGSYVLESTQFPLYGTVGATVTASEKSYDHYHVNTERSVLSGTVVAPTTDGEEISYLVLKVYYDLDTVTISYDLNGGTGAEDVDYSSESVKYGAGVTVKAEPTRAGYVFTGWTSGETSYNAGDSIVLTENMTLVAQWEEIYTPPANGTIVPPISGSPVVPEDDDEALPNEDTTPEDEVAPPSTDDALPPIEDVPTVPESETPPTVETDTPADESTNPPEEATPEAQEPSTPQETETPAEPELDNTPKTNDDTHMTALFIVLILSGVALVWLAIYELKKHPHD
jgi:uncharacterized repeat protein (TIGR02543 family)